LCRCTLNGRGRPLERFSEPYIVRHCVIEMVSAYLTNSKAILINMTWFLQYVQYPSEMAYIARGKYANIAGHMARSDRKRIL